MKDVLSSRLLPVESELLLAFVMAHNHHPLSPRQALTVNGSPKFFRTEEVRLTGIQIIPPPDGFRDLIKAAVLAAMRGQGVKQPQGKGRPFTLAQFARTTLKFRN